MIPEKKARRIARINTPEDRRKAYPFVITAGHIRLLMVPPYGWASGEETQAAPSGVRRQAK